MSAAEAGARSAIPCAFVILGASGDLARRKLVPALFNLRCHGLLGPDFAVVGVARAPGSHDTFRDDMERAVRRHAAPFDESAWRAFREQIYYQSGQVADADGHAALAALLDEVAVQRRTRGNALFYLALPPGLFAPVVERLAAARLLEEGADRWRRVIVEKPFGTDLDSARALNRDLGAVLAERQVYRIDHYLGKETVQNILVFRFANGIFEPIWDRQHVDHVQVTVAESLGVEGRGPYYESAGALRDMVQNHMLQLLAVVAMEPPASFEADRVRDERVKVLEAIPRLRPEEVLSCAVRGQYGPGAIGGEAVPGYRSEPRVSPGSTTETLAALRLSVDNWRWAGVPFYLRTGKRLARRSTEIVIQFRRPPRLLFPETAAGQMEANRLILSVQPEEGMTLEIKAKRPAPKLRLETVRLDFTYADFGPLPETTGYERLLHDAMAGDSTLFHRADMVEAAWEVVTPVLEAWADLPPRDFPNYTAGSWGPPASDALLARDGRQWLVPGAGR